MPKEVSLELLYTELLSLKSINYEYLNIIKSLKAENESLSNRVEELEVKVHRLEQLKLKNKIDIVGVPNVTNENARELSLKVLTDALGVEISADHIVDCYTKTLRSRTNGTNSDSGNTNIISSPNSHADAATDDLDATNVNQNTNKSQRSIICVEFASPAHKKAVLLAKKSNKNKLKATLFDANNKNKIFVNESLSSYFRALLSAGRALKNEKKLKYVWFKNSLVHFKKTDKSKVVVAKSFHDLESIKNIEF